MCRFFIWTCFSASSYCTIGQTIILPCLDFSKRKIEPRAVAVWVSVWHLPFLFLTGATFRFSVFLCVILFLCLWSQYMLQKVTPKCADMSAHSALNASLVHSYVSLFLHACANTVADKSSNCWNLFQSKNNFVMVLICWLSACLLFWIVSLQLFWYARACVCVHLDCFDDTVFVSLFLALYPKWDAACLDMTRTSTLLPSLW